MSDAALHTLFGDRPDGVAGVDSTYQGAQRRDVDSRAQWLEQRIRSASANGGLSQYDASNDMHELNSIRRQEAGMRRDDGVLSPRDEARLQTRLDNLSATVRQSVNGQGF